MIPLIDIDTCTGCGQCLEVCPPEALFLQNEKAHLKSDLCEECGFCAAECPVEAISIAFPLSGI